MKKVTDITAVGMAIFITVGWWGMLYPHLTMLEDTCRMIDSTGEVRMIESMEDYFGLLQAETEQIHIKSRLLERE